MPLKINTDFSSPNFDERTLPVSMLVLHYTGMESGKAAINRLCDPGAKVSAHYVVRENGDILQLVDENNRAWHAGVGSWDGVTNINSASVGIEIVNGGHDFGLPGFPQKQIGAVIELGEAICERHEIAPINIVGHSDIAPGRKQDPGEKFPWDELAGRGLGWVPAAQEFDDRDLFAGSNDSSSVKTIQAALGFIGYGINVSGKLDQQTCEVVEAFQRRYRPALISRRVDVQTIGLITAVANFKKSGNAACMD